MKNACGLSKHCLEKIIGVRDTQELIAGKWKTAIIGMLQYNGRTRFMDMKRGLEGIASKVLSNELKELEMNHLVRRIVESDAPLSVAYELTSHGKRLTAVIDSMASWGIAYRKRILVHKQLD